MRGPTGGAALRPGQMGQIRGVFPKLSLRDFLYAILRKNAPYLSHLSFLGEGRNSTKIASEIGRLGSSMVAYAARLHALVEPGRVELPSKRGNASYGRGARPGDPF